MQHYYVTWRLPHPGDILGGLLDLVELKDEIHHSVSNLRVKIASFTTPHKKTRDDKKLK